MPIAKLVLSSKSTTILTAHKLTSDSIYCAWNAFKPTPNLKQNLLWGRGEGRKDKNINADLHVQPFMSRPNHTLNSCLQLGNT